MPTSDDKRPTPPNSREQRLAEALRVNLKRRKVADRSKTASIATPPPEPDAEG